MAAGRGAVIVVTEGGGFPPSSLGEAGGGSVGFVWATSSGFV